MADLSTVNLNSIGTAEKILPGVNLLERSKRTIAHHPSIFTPRCGALQEKDWNPNSAGDPRRAANGNKELLLLELLRHFK